MAESSAELLQARSGSWPAWAGAEVLHEGAELYQRRKIRRVLEGGNVDLLGLVPDRGLHRATDLTWVQALVRGLMKFVVKEFLSARRAVLPRESRPGLTAPGRTVSHSSFPGNDLERIAGGQAHPMLRQKARSGSTSVIFWRFDASNSLWRVTAGKEGPKAMRAMRGSLCRIRVAR